MTIRRTNLFVLIFALLFARSHLSIAVAQTSTAAQLTPETADIIFDIHGVLVQFDWDAAAHVVEEPAVVDFFVQAFQNWAKKIVHKLYDDRYEKVIAAAIRLLAMDNVSGEGFYNLFNHYQFGQMADSIRKLGLAYTITPGIMTLLERVAQAGYRLHIASNIGTGFLDALQHKYPKLFSFFPCRLAVDMDKIEHGKIPVRKPDPRYYESLREICDISDKSILIFVDDLPENVKSTRKMPNWIPIQFDTVPRLEKKLEQLLKDFAH